MSANAPPHEAVGDAGSRPACDGSHNTTTTDASRTKPRARPARLLVALHGERSPERALRFAEHLAVALSAELHVLRVIPPTEGVCGAGDVLATALRDARRVLSTARRTRALCESVLSAPLPNLHLCVRLGRFVEQVAQRAAEIDAMLIGLPSTKRPLAPTAIHVARHADCPVIVTRGRPNIETLIAATDLEDGQVPLLRRAAQLGRDLRATVVALHGVHGTGGGHAEMGSLESRQCKLALVTRGFEAPLERVVVPSSDPASCILEQARARNAGLIVVGVRPHLTRTRPSTAAKLLRRARGPVLVAPLRPAPQGA